MSYQSKHVLIVIFHKSFLLLTDKYIIGFFSLVFSNHKPGRNKAIGSSAIKCCPFDFQIHLPLSISSKTMPITVSTKKTRKRGIRFNLELTIDKHSYIAFTRLGYFLL